MKNNYLSGFIGALIGAILFTLPWVIVYIYMNFILSVLGAVIGFGAYTFYKLFGGKNGKSTPIIIIITSLIGITVASFVIIPLWLIAKEGYGFNPNLLHVLYSNGDFMGEMIKNYIISLLFTGLGISGVIRKIKAEPVEDQKIV